ncbi:MAG: ABC transporter permease subunit [Halobacteriota archaeon]
MSWTLIAREDFSDAVGSRSLWALVGVYVLLAVGSAVILSSIPELGDSDGSIVVSALASPASILIPVTALFVAYKAVVGERESGTGLFLLSLPHTRLDVIVGKMVGRTAVLCLSALVGFLGGAAATSLLFGRVQVVEFLTFVVVTLFFAVAYVGLMVGISAIASTEQIATVLAVGVMIVVEFLWGLVLAGAHFLVEGTFAPRTEIVEGAPIELVPEWYAFLELLSPSGAWGRMLSATLPDMQYQYALAFGGDVPLYLSGWMGFVILLGWLFVPLSIGYVRFARADL